MGGVVGVGGVVGWRSDWGGRRRFCGVMASLVGGGTVRVAGSWWEEGFWGWWAVGGRRVCVVCGSWLEEGLGWEG